VPNPEGRIIKRFQIIKTALQVDAIVSVSKLKTHLLTGMTAATKNLFGLVPGYEKASFHGRLADPMDFSRMLVDLNELMRPQLQIMDAVIGMEGDGPNSGEPRKIGAILASGSYAHIDVVAARIIGMAPIDIPTIAAEVERGLLDKNLGASWSRERASKLSRSMISGYPRPSPVEGGSGAASSSGT
jgi:uncharacterized protein (DUF362 family)